MLLGTQAAGQLGRLGRWDLRLHLEGWDVWICAASFKP